MLSSFFTQSALELVEFLLPHLDFADERLPLLPRGDQVGTDVLEGGFALLPRVALRRAHAARQTAQLLLRLVLDDAVARVAVLGVGVCGELDLWVVRLARCRGRRWSLHDLLLRLLAEGRARFLFHLRNKFYFVKKSW